jgi:hypothetical protein
MSRHPEELVYIKPSVHARLTEYSPAQLVAQLLSSNGLTAVAKTEAFNYSLTRFKANEYHQYYLSIYSQSVLIGNVRAIQPPENNLKRKFINPPPYKLNKDYLPESQPQFEHSGAIGLGQSLIVQALLWLSHQSHVEGYIDYDNYPSVFSRLKMRCLNTPEPSFYPTALIKEHLNQHYEPCHRCITFFGPKYQRFNTPFSITEAEHLGATLNQSLPLILNRSH